MLTAQELEAIRQIVREEIARALPAVVDRCARCGHEVRNGRPCYACVQREIAEKVQQVGGSQH